jgi:predicted RNA-binding protein associated with RNAse of E/G family
VTHPTVHIHYLRPPGRKEVFDQLLLHDGPDVKVTLARNLVVEPPIRIADDVVLESGSDVVWFTFPDVWHDIGRFHTADGTFRGFYANILTPPTFHPGGIWHTTDLFLDIWLPADGRPSVLDRDQFEEARREGWLDATIGARALEEMDRILAAFQGGTWPPEVVHGWTRERSIETAYPATDGPSSPDASSPTT